MLLCVAGPVNTHHSDCIVIYLNTRFSAFVQRFTCGQSVEKGERFVPAAVCSRSSSVSAHCTASCELVSMSPSCVLVSTSPSCVLVSRSPSCVLVSTQLLDSWAAEPNRPGMNCPALLDTSQLDLRLAQSAWPQPGTVSLTLAWHSRFDPSLAQAAWLQLGTVNLTLAWPSWLDTS